MKKQRVIMNIYPDVFFVNASRYEEAKMIILEQKFSNSKIYEDFANNVV